MNETYKLYERTVHSGYKENYCIINEYSNKFWYFCELKDIRNPIWHNKCNNIPFPIFKTRQTLLLEFKTDKKITYKYMLKNYPELFI